MTNHQTLALQAPIINLTFNLSSENLAAGQEKPSRDSRSKEVLQVEEKSRSRVNQPNMRLNANIGISQPLNDVLRHLDAQRYSSTSISTRDSTSSLEDYPLTRRRKLLDPTTARARNDSDLARISKLIREDPLPVRTLANRMIALSTRLVDIGNTEMACEFGRRTVSVLRKTRGYKVDRFYGNALQHCSFFYSSAGNHSEALRFAQDAVTIFSDISRLKPRQEKAGVNLGMALNTLGYALSSVGLIDEAVDACRRSVELLRTLHYQSRSVYKADLALCMVNYSNCMLDSRQFSEAVRVTSEAGYIYERCYSVEPSTYGWEYGVCLSTQAKCLIAHGHVQDALPAIKESIRVFREFDSRSPGQLNGELASALLNCFEVYFELHRETEARTIVLETLGLFRRLATKNPSMFRLKLADTLKCSARLNFRESCYEQADRDLQEALSIFKNDSRRYVDKINLARSLQLAAICRRRLGDYHNAKDCAQQAVDVRRELAGRNHSNALYHKIQLAEAQLELCRCRANLHLNDKVSLKILTDVKEIYHCIAGAQKFWLAKDMHKMALGLHSLSKLQIAAKQHSEALNSVQDAVKYLEAATAQRSDVYVESDFVKLYITQSTLYSQFGHHNQAMDSARRAVEMANILWDTDAQNRLLELAKKRFMARNTTMEQYFLQSMSHLVSAGQTKVHFQDALVA
ncbi:hypothetical protein BDQ17DRAFT_1368882 [Cyathus striatus]|nr:hypothetical protein BDQ17DRAFT_1368882 [Cyathus striatus]